MHHQTDYALIKLTCHNCRTRDLGDTSEYMARKAGWTEIVTSDQPHEQRIHQWWTHLGFCPACHANNIQRRKENQPVKHNAIKFIASLAVGAALIFAMSVTAAPSEPPPRPRPTDMGACCYGSGYVVAFTTRRDCNTAVDSPSGKPGMFVNGAVPTVGENPCDVLPGGD